jgi:hypothetical protein
MCEHCNLLKAFFDKYPFGWDWNINSIMLYFHEMEITYFQILNGLKKNGATAVLMSNSPPEALPEARMDLKQCMEKCCWYSSFLLLKKKRIHEKKLINESLLYFQEMDLRSFGE